MSKEYKVNKMKLSLCVSIFLIIVLIIVGIYFKLSIESKEVLGNYTDSSVDQICHNMDAQYYNEEMGSLILIFAMTIIFFHIYLFTKTKLIMNSKGIELYSIYTKNPSNTFYWNEIKSIQIGDVIESVSRMPRYGIKIRHIKKTDSEHEQLKEFIPIGKLDNYFDLIKDLEAIGGELNIDIYHMDD